MPEQDNVEEIEQETVEVEEVEVVDDGNADSQDDALTAGKLYDTILRHPDWRVVEVSAQGPDYCHPLKYIYSDGDLRFQYDGAARQLHHEAECEEIIDLNGFVPFDEERYGKSVYILQDLYVDEWDEESTEKIRVRKSTLDASAKWIKLHPEKR